MSSSQLQADPLTQNMRDVASDAQIKRYFWRYAIPSIAAMLVSGRLSNYRWYFCWSLCWC
ncbi:MAG: hypothetical protein ACI9LG_002536 [Moritella dasanensis]